VVLGGIGVTQPDQALAHRDDLRMCPVAGDDVRFLAAELADVFGVGGA
jgi:hypothetical protein